MLVSEVIREKNKIFRKYLGLDFDLIPESQIEECTQIPLSMHSSFSSCPYCVVYGKDCKECPMSKAGNKCDTYGSTWRKYCNFIYFGWTHISPRSPAYLPMVALIEQYNKELEVGNE